MANLREYIKKGSWRGFERYLKDSFPDSYNNLNGYIHKQKKRFFDTLRALEPVLPDKSGLKFMDAGIFPGYFARICARFFEAEISGIGLNVDDEFTGAMSRDSISIYSADLTRDLPEELCGRYDVVTALEILEHIDPRDAMAFISNLKKMAVSGGIVFITTPNVTTLRKRFDLIRGRSPHPPLEDSVIHKRDRYWVHLREYALHEVRTMVRTAGLDYVAGGYIDLTRPGVSAGRKLLNSLLYLIPSLRHGLFLVARKP